jgi:hypothetical protein
MKAETTTFLSHQEIFNRAAMHLQQQGRAGLLQRGVAPIAVTQASAQWVT